MREWVKVAMWVTASLFVLAILALTGLLIHARGATGPAVWASVGTAVVAGLAGFAFFIYGVQHPETRTVTNGAPSRARPVTRTAPSGPAVPARKVDAPTRPSPPAVRPATRARTVKKATTARVRPAPKAEDLISLAVDAANDEAKRDALREALLQKDRLESRPVTGIHRGPRETPGIILTQEQLREQADQERRFGDSFFMSAEEIEERERMDRQLDRLAEENPDDAFAILSHRSGSGVPTLDSLNRARAHRRHTPPPPDLSYLREDYGSLPSKEMIRKYPTRYPVEVVAAVMTQDEEVSP